MDRSAAFEELHLTDADVTALLEEHADHQLVERANRHLDACTQCQQLLEVRAAKQQEWDQYASIMVGADLNASTNGEIAEFLEPARHPEFIGRIGKYEVEREVGRGGMGIVYKAYDSELDRPLAIKVLQLRIAANGTARQRFAAESRAAAAVIHPNVMPIYEVSSSGRIPYFAMPLITGDSLQRFVEDNGPLPEKTIVRIANQIASGLAAAHAQGIVHRDIKPENILLDSDPGRIVIADFGLARAADDASMTQSGYFVGTPNFMSPEQAAARSVDGRSDLFGLGSVVYYMATGHLPFEADSSLSVMYRIAKDDPKPIRELNSDLSENLESLVNRLLQKEPENRFASAAELHSQLETYLAHLHQPVLVPAPKFKHAGKKHSRKRFPWKQTISVFGILILLIASTLSGFPEFVRSFTSGNLDRSASPIAEPKEASEPTTSPKLQDNSILGGSLELPRLPDAPDPMEPPAPNAPLEPKDELEKVRQHIEQLNEHVELLDNQLKTKSDK